MNKKIKIGRETYRMYQVKSTGWVFVEGQRSKATFSIAKVVDGKIIEVDHQEVFSHISNQELAEAWVAQ